MRASRQPGSRGQRSKHVADHRLRRQGGRLQIVAERCRSAAIAATFGHDAGNGWQATTSRLGAPGIPRLLLRQRRD